MQFLAPATETYDESETHSTSYKRSITLCFGDIILKYVLVALLLIVSIWTVFSQLQDIDRGIFNAFFNAINFIAALIYSKWAVGMMREVNTQVTTFRAGLAMMRSVFRHPALNVEQCQEVKKIATKWFSLFVIAEDLDDLYSDMDYIESATQTLVDDSNATRSLQRAIDDLAAHILRMITQRQSQTVFLRAGTVMDNIFILFYLFVLLPLTIFHQTDSILASIIIAVLVLIFLGHPMIWMSIVGDPFNTEEKLVHRYTGHLCVEAEDLCDAIQTKVSQLQGILPSDDFRITVF